VLSTDPVWLALVTSDWISIVGTGVSVAGFIWVIIQTTRVGRAVQRQQRQTAGVFLLARTGDLERIELDAHSATTAAEARRALIDWRRVAAELNAVLDATGRGSVELDEALRLSLGMIDYALVELGDGVGPTAALDPIVREMSRACGASRSLGAGMMVKDEAE
jgi:hypothetical protein